MVTFLVTLGYHAGYVDRFWNVDGCGCCVNSFRGNRIVKTCPTGSLASSSEVVGCPLRNSTMHIC